MADMTRGEDIHGTVGPSSEGDVNASQPSSDGPRFQIIRPHDEGGLGKVSVALDTELDREVALKEIKPQYADDASSRSRFLLEAEITGGLEHPGIVPIYALGASADGRPYYAMRFIRGDNLATAIKQYHEGEQASEQSDRTVQLRRLLSRFLDVSNAVYYAHQRGVLHRDLKPGNVMLGEYGETLVVDWGLAKPIGASEESTSESDESPTIASPLVPRSGSVVDATQLGSAIGSPHYMSPEQARGEHDKLGPAADVYGLGATLFTLLTNRKPVEGATLEEILEAVQKGPTKTARQWNPEIDAALSKICAKAMSLSTEERYKTVRALADDVERYLADEPVRAYPEPLTRRTRRWMRKHPRLVGSATATLVAGVVSAATIAGVVSSSNTKLGEKNVELAEANTQLEVAKEDAEAARDEAVKSRDQAVIAKSHAEEVSDFMVDALRSPDPDLNGRSVTVAQVLDKAALELDERFSETPLTKAALQYTLGRTYLGLSLAQEAIPLLRESLEVREQQLGTEHPDTLESMFQLANSYQIAGESARALELLKTVYDLRVQTLGADHLDTLLALNGIANSHLDRGDANQALTVAQEVKQRLSNTVGDDHKDSLQLMNNMAVIYGKLGKPQEAIALNEQSLARLQKQLGPEHRFTLISMNNLAEAYRVAGQYAKAVELHEESLEQMRSKLGDNHQSTVISMSNLSEAYRGIGENQKALALNRQALTILRETVGPDHQKTLTIMANLASLYHDTGQLDEAMPLYQEVLQRQEELLGNDHPNTLLSLHNLATGLTALGQTKEALSASSQAYDLSRTKLGENHPQTLSILAYLATLHRMVGNIPEAVKLHEKALELRREKLGAKHPDTLWTMTDLATSYLYDKQYLKSIQLHEQATKMLREVLGDEHPTTILARRNLANAYNFVGRQEEAIELLKELFELLQIKHGAAHEATRSTMDRLVAIYETLGKNSAAIELLEGALRDALLRHGKLHPDSIAVRNALASGHSRFGEYERAIELHQENLALIKEALGENHFYNRIAYSNLAITYAQNRQFRSAETIYKKLLALEKQISKQPTQSLLNAEFQLATMYRMLGRLEDAAQWFRQAEQHAIELHGPMHAERWKAWAAYGTTLLLLEENDTTIQLCELSLPAARETGDWMIAMNQALHAYALLGKKDFEAAYNLAESSLHLAKKAAPQTKQFPQQRGVLGCVLAHRQEWEEADKMLRQAIHQLKPDRAQFDDYDWHFAARLYLELARVHREWEGSTEREKWQDELQEFEEERAALDPLSQGNSVEKND